MITDLLTAEIAEGQAEPLARAARRFPSSRQGRPVTISCLVRWITDGVRLPGGERVRLEAARLSGRWITTPAAICRFVVAQTPDLDATPATPRTAARRRRAAERAGERLEKLGI